MVSRRVLAWAEFVSGLLALLLARYLRGRTDATDEPPRSSYWLSVGAACSVAYHWLYDRDVGGIRRNWGRRAMAAVAWAVASNRSVLGSETAARNFADGSLFGTLGYRFWFGLVRPVPGPDGE